MKDYSHLNSTELRLSHERERLAASKTEEERELREVWVRQIEKEVEGELKRLGIERQEVTDEDLEGLLQ